MKRVLLAVALLAVAATAIYGYSVTRRERQYRQLVVDGEYATARGDHYAAVSAFGGAIALRPDAMLGYLKRGAAHRRRGDLEAAAADLQRAAALDPTAPRVLEVLGDVESGRELHEQAAGHYAAALRLDDSVPRLHYKLGLARHLAGNAPGAIEALTRAVALDGRFAEAHYLLGVCLREQNQLRQAEQELRYAISLSPSLVAPREQLADLYRAQERRADRIAELERLLSLDPAPARQVTLALAYADHGRTDRAVRLLRSATALYPDYARTHVALGRVWLQAAEADGDRVSIDKAIEALQHAVAMNPSGEALLQLGRAQLAARDAESALRTLRDATETLPADPAAFLLLAEAAEQAGHPDVARRARADHRALLPK